MAPNAHQKKTGPLGHIFWGCARAASVVVVIYKNVHLEYVSFVDIVRPGCSIVDSFHLIFRLYKFGSEGSNSIVLSMQKDLISVWIGPDQLLQVCHCPRDVASHLWGTTDIYTRPPAEFT